MAKHKYASWMAAFVLGLSIVGYQPVKKAITEIPVNKNFTLAIYKENNYTSEAYACTYAQVHVTVEKVKGYKRSVEWDSTFDAKLLRDYPSLENAYTQEVTISNVFASKENIEVKYVLTYYSNGSQLQMQSGSVLKEANEKLDIGI